MAFKELLRINLKHTAFKHMLKARYKNGTLHFGFPSTIISSYLPFFFFCMLLKTLLVKGVFIRLVLAAVPSDVSKPGISPD